MYELCTHNSVQSNSTGYSYSPFMLLLSICTVSCKYHLHNPPPYNIDIYLNVILKDFIALMLSVSNNTS